MSRATPERLVAARVLRRFLKRPGRLDQWLNEEGSELDGDQRRRARALLYAALRNRTLLERALHPYLETPLGGQRPAPRVALLLGATELLCLDGVPDRAAVDQAVELCRALGGRGQAGFVNAVLRRLLREGGAPELPDRDEDPIGWAKIACSHPRWIVDEFSRELGPAGAAALCEAGQQEPPTVIAVPDAARRTGLQDELGAEPGALAPWALRLPRGLGRLDAVPGFAEGAFWAQDEAAQLVTRLVGDVQGARVLDACAAPGGKTFALAHLVGPDGAVVATDSDPRRLELVARGAARLGLEQVLCEPRDWVAEPFGAREDDEAFDAVLVDAPCSGLGVIRRHPDIRWARRRGDLDRYAERQVALVEALAPAVRPGGRFVYAVCTLSSQETHGVLARTSPGERLDARGLLPDLPDDAFSDGALRTLPHLHDADGFFAAAFQRSTP